MGLYGLPPIAFRHACAALIIFAFQSLFVSGDGLARLVHSQQSSEVNPLSILNAGLWGISHNGARPWYVGGQKRRPPAPPPPHLPPTVEQGGNRVDQSAYTTTVCPFYADPLVGTEGSYVSCAPREIAACPSGYLCDRSNSLGAHICCKDSLGPAIPVTTTTQPPSPSPPEPSTPVQPSLVIAQWSSWSPETVWSGWAAVTPPTTPYGKPKPPPTPPRTRPPTPGTPSPQPRGSWLPQTWSSWQTLPTGGPTSSWSGWERVRTTQSPPPEPRRPTLTPFLPVHPVPFGGNPKVRVMPLIIGSLTDKGRSEYEQETTVTLIEDGALTILYDTGLPTDQKDILDGLVQHAVRPQDIDFVIISHGHPEHFGNQNLFPNQRQLFHIFEYTGKHFRKTELAEQPYRLLGQNTEIWKTPGHTQQDITLLIRNVPTLGTVAVVGDLIPNEQLYMSSQEIVFAGAWDVTTQRQNANMMICMADSVIPGHGRMFKITEKHRIRANCPSSPVK